jgi:LPXTG-motif cell wall-anchored protein
MFALASALLIVSAGAALADMQPEAAIPQPQPMVIGTVSSTTVHTVSVTTADGEKITFEFDSRTVKPAALAANTPVRVEFRLLDSGLHLAHRITPLEPGAAVNTLQARATRVQHETRQTTATRQLGQGHEVTKSDDKATARETAANPQTAPKDQTAIGSTPEGGKGVAAQVTSTPAGNGGEKQQLPQTASELPWVLSIGALLLVASAALWLWRRRAAA